MNVKQKVVLYAVAVGTIAMVLFPPRLISTVSSYGGYRPMGAVDGAVFLAQWAVLVTLGVVAYMLLRTKE